MNTTVAILGKIVEILKEANKAQGLAIESPQTSSGNTGGNSPVTITDTGGPEESPKCVAIDANISTSINKGEKKILDIINLREMPSTIERIVIEQDFGTNGLRRIDSDSIDIPQSERDFNSVNLSSYSNIDSDSDRFVSLYDDNQFILVNTIHQPSGTFYYKFRYKIECSKETKSEEFKHILLRIKVKDKTS